MSAFACKCSIAPDDFTPSSIISTAIRFCLFCWILCANAYILVTLDSSADCPDGVNCCSPQPSWVLTAYLFGELFLEFLVMTVSFLIFLVSASGTLRERFSDYRAMEQEHHEDSRKSADCAGATKSRLRTLQVFLCTRVALFFPEVCFSVLGLVVAFHPQLLNQPPCASYNIFQLLAAYSIATAVVSSLNIIYYLAVLDPAGWCSPGPIDYITEVEGVSYRNTQGSRVHRTRKTHQTLHRNRTTQLWQKCINMLACGSVNGSQNVNSSVLEVAKLLTAVFQFPNYTLSDIATALALLSNEQKDCCSKHSAQECFKLKILREKLYQELKENEFCDEEQDKHQPPVPVNLDDPGDFTEVEDAVYFFRYAMAVYGWSLYVFANPMTGCCKLCYKSSEICCIQGNCCRCTDAAFKLMAEMGIREDRVVYSSERNELFFTPYKVVLDHTKKALVVTIRGTLSVEDVITSLSISLTPILVDEPPYDTLDTQVHKGWYTTAENILNELSDAKGLNIFQFFTNTMYKDYRLVVVGHSLGGAVAAVLSVLIKQRHKEHAHRLKSFGYSTPGCVFTYPLAKYCRDFVTTVILDNDILPRLTWRTILLLRETLKETLETCNKPKHQVLYTDPIVAAYKKVRSKLKQEDVEEEETAASTTETYCAFVQSVYDNPDWKKSLGPFFGEHMSFESAVNAIRMARRWQGKAGISTRPTEQIFEHNNPRAFLPGKVLQIDTEKERLRSWLPWPKRSRCQLKWVANADYCQIHLHGGPLSSHLPNSVCNALHMVKEQHLRQRGSKHVLSWTKTSQNIAVCRHSVPSFHTED